MDRVGSATLDREVLQALYWSSGGPRWKRNEGWAENDEDMNSWHGVKLDKDGRVLKLDLTRNSLHGTIPAALGCLGHLVYLRMSFNSLTGPLPCTLSNLSRLNYMDIRENQLTGSLPADFGKLTDLSQLDLSCNLLGGHIPPEIGDMRSLLQCWLEKNHIQGPIPAELAMIPHLTDLDLAENRIEEGRMKGKELAAWKESARRRLIAEQRNGRRGSGTCGSCGVRGGEDSFDTREYLENMVAKDREISELRAENERLRRGRSGTGGDNKVISFFRR